MRRSDSAPLCILGTLLSSVGITLAHSWIEAAQRIAPDGALIGPLGYARGWVPRNTTDPPWHDTIPLQRLPYDGQTAYSGQEILNKFPKDLNPGMPMLEAAPGDHIAIFHLENGHTTVLTDRPKPRNAGTIFLYGTTQPADQEKLFDVHLQWTRDGKGGDGRGHLLGTRNYDDGQCVQGAPTPIGNERMAALGITNPRDFFELPCQSDVKLPDSLKDGDIYTIYWYWDWPDLNPDQIDLEKTTDGIFPWGGSFLHNATDRNGFKADAIKINESYSSVMDIKIRKPTALRQEGLDAKAVSLVSTPVEGVPAYYNGVKNQMANNFQVDPDGKGRGNTGSIPGHVDKPDPGAGQKQPGAGSSSEVGPGQTVTVTESVTVPPATVIKTVTVTGGVDAARPSMTMPNGVFVPTNPPGVHLIEEPASPSSADLEAPPAEATATCVQSGGRPCVTPFMRARRNWAFGQ